MKFKVAVPLPSVFFWSLRNNLFAGDHIMLNYIDSCTVPLEFCDVCLWFLINHLYSSHSFNIFPCYFTIRGRSGGGEATFQFSFFGEKKCQALSKSIAKVFGRTSEQAQEILNNSPFISSGSLSLSLQDIELSI